MGCSAILVQNPAESFSGALLEETLSTLLSIILLLSSVNMNRISCATRNSPASSSPNSGKFQQYIGQSHYF
jgi:hypothetical protein